MNSTHSAFSSSKGFSAVRLLCGMLFCLSLQTSNAFAQCANKIVCENALPGDTGWDPYVDDTTIQGYTTDISVNVGQTITFKIKTNATNYRLDIYRLGYYGGAGARKVETVTPSASLPQTQPPCLQDAATGLADCGNWAPSAAWLVPSTSVSGLYFANLVRTDNGGFSQVFFVVRDDASHSDVLYQTSDQTWHAYNPYGGHSLYGGANTFDLSNRAYKVSYNRPVVARSFSATSFVYNGEVPMIRWLEANGYDVSYFSDVDAARSGSLIQNHKLYLSTGHDEYVDAQRRASTEAARDAGVNLAFFSGNEFFWKTRWENSIDGSGTPYRTMVCYKETYFGSGNTYVKDPANPPTWTGTWRDPRFSPPADGGRPENALTGTLFVVNGPGADNTNLSILVPAADGKMRFWRNTSVATLGVGQTATLPAGSLGYEWDIDADNGVRPPGLVPLSTSTYQLTTDLLLDYGASYGAGSATHHLTLYKAPSGALVFGAGSVQWSWGLDNYHYAASGNTVDVRMQQATINLFADMGVQPGTLQPGLLAAAKSTDTVAPATTITAPAANGTVTYGVATTISGTAADTGGGVVGAVEVSVDGGQSWHPANGREQWSYNWTPSTLTGSANIQARAADDSANLQSTPAIRAVTVTGSPACPCSIWSASATPATASANDPSSLELGLKFKSDAAGFITGIRFYKGPSNTGTHVGHLWALNGSNLGTVTFTGETGSGWQQANFASPVAVSANTTYVVSYYAPNGGYSINSNAFSSAGVDTPPLHALMNGTDGGNGVYLYASGGGFPINTFNSSNYWVDVVFTTSAASTYNISGTIAGGAGATVTLSGAGSGSTTADGSGNYSFSNLANGNYTVTPTKTGFTISPASRAVTVSGANAGGVNFTATATTYSISGTISPAASGSGATVTLSGADSGTTTADASGNYTFSGLSDGNYTVTPAKTGVTFTPANRAVAVSGGNATGINFAAAAGTFSISGTISPVANGSGATVTLSGAGSGTTTADGSGNYSFANLANGNYTVTPTKTGLTFTPANAAVTVNNANVANVNFTAGAAATYSISGTISPAANGSGATVTLSGAASATATANASGAFSFGSLSNGNYTVTPTKAGFTFTPASVPVTVNNANVANVNFTGGSSATTYSISGNIVNGANATVALSGAATGNATADASGNYSFTGVASGNYTVTPTKTGWSITPANRAVTVSGANVASVNFTANQATSIWSSSATPATAAASDTAAVEVGLKFRSDVAGTITGVRFYKGTTNTGTHVGHLWSSTGTQLGSVTFTGETASGWQQANFATPVAVTANTTYVISYYAPVGRYAFTNSAFASAGVDNIPLHALSNTAGGGNGIYRYGAGGGFPNSSYNATNYWVDVVFAPAP